MPQTFIQRFSRFRVSPNHSNYHWHTKSGLCIFLLHKWIYPQLLILIKTSISQLLEVGLSSQIKRFIENIHNMFVFLHRKCWLCKVGWMWAHWNWRIVFFPKPGNIIIVQNGIVLWPPWTKFLGGLYIYARGKFATTGGAEGVLASIDHKSLKSDL